MTATAMSKLGRSLRAGLPLLISLVALYLVYRRVPLADVWRSLKGSELQLFLPLSLAYFGAVLSADSLALTCTLRWFLCEARFGEILPMRASTYLLSLVNYQLGLGGIALYLARTKPGVTLISAAGLMLLMMGVNLLVILGTAALGTRVAGTPLPDVARWLLLAAAAALPFYLMLIAGHPRSLATQLKTVAIVRPLFSAGPLGHAKAALIRLPHIAVMVLGHWLALRCFHVDVPWGDAVAALPLVLLVGALPISIQGIGPVQMASIALLAKFSTAATTELREAAVLAESLSFSSIFLLLQLLTGLIFLPRALRDLGQRAQPEPLP